jgi:predicted amidohydrolase
LAVDLVAGSFLERIPGEEKFANTCVHVAASGAVRAVYRKLHMFDVRVDGRSYRESDIELPGDEIVLSETSSGVELGLAICYDLRFPELFRILAVRGARILALPSAFTLPTTRDHWEVLVRARSIENQAFTIAANQVGPHPGGMRSGGRSMIVDPWGVILAQAPDGEHHIVAELDLERQLEIRAQLPALANRRPEAYIWPEETDSTVGAEETDAAGTAGLQEPGAPGTAGPQEPGAPGTAGLQEPGAAGTAGLQEPGAAGADGIGTQAGGSVR